MRRYPRLMLGFIIIVALFLVFGGVKAYLYGRDFLSRPVIVEFQRSAITNPPITVRYRSEKEQVWHLFPTNRLALHTGRYFFRFSRADYEDCVVETFLGLNRQTNVVLAFPASWKERLAMARLRFARRALLANDWHILGDVLFSEKKAGSFECASNAEDWQQMLTIWSDREAVRTELEAWSPSDLTVDKLPATLSWLASLKPLAELDPLLAAKWKRIAKVVGKYLSSVVLNSDCDWLELVAIFNSPATTTVFGEGVYDLRKALDDELSSNGVFLVFRIGLLQRNGLLSADGYQMSDKETLLRLQ